MLFPPHINNGLITCHTTNYFFFLGQDAFPPAFRRGQCRGYGRQKSEELNFCQELLSIRWTQIDAPEFVVFLSHERLRLSTIEQRQIMSDLAHERLRLSTTLNRRPAGANSTIGCERPKTYSGKSIVQQNVYPCVCVCVWCVNGIGNVN